MLRSGQSLIAALVATTAVVSGALAWAGWRLLDQQRAIDDQRSRERIETAADALASGISSRLAEAGDRLSAWLSNPADPVPAIDGALVVTIGPGGARQSRSTRLPFLPSVPPPRVLPAAFAEAERIEFGGGSPHAALARYRALASSADSELRAEALMRLCRVMRTVRDFNRARQCAARLASEGNARAGNLPAELAGLEAERLARRGMGDRAGESRAAEQVRDGIDAGRWPLSRGTAEFYRESTGGAGQTDGWTLARALDDVWRTAGSPPEARGRRMVTQNGRPVLVMWRAAERHAAMLVGFGDRLLPPQVPALQWRLTDPEGRMLAGADSPFPRAVVRIAGDSADPWTLHVASPADGAVSAGPRRVLLAMMGAMLGFLWAASYFIGRAIRREARAARMQSEFVNAVSHEFRSPLTTIRQMAEMLETGRVASAPRRDEYYGMIAGESARLQHLVETLLNFGKMQDAGGRYRFAEIPAASVIAAAAGDVQVQAAGKHTQIVITGPADDSLIRGDEPSLRLAISNLIDNAVKYSPAGSVVRVTWGLDNGRAVINVADSGPGIPHEEQRDIFRKFVRGRAALETNIRGTGLGLSLVQEIARAHNGEVHLESEPGRGSVFTLRLPLAEQSAGMPS